MAMAEETIFDVLVLGAGFAGVTAAREMKNSGHKVAILEARDRIGGRVWTSELDGTKIEYGATWIHWFQPYVWSEFMRAGLEIHEDPWFPPITIHVEGKPQPLAFDRFREMLNEGWHAFAKTTAGGHVMERPYHLSELTNAEALDALTVQEVIDSLAIEPLAKIAFAAEITVQMNAHPKDVSYLSQLRWWSASGWDVSLMIDCLARYKVETGLTSLISFMVERAKLDIRLEKPVAKVEQTAGRIVVTTRSGETFTCKKLVCALPMNCLKDVDFAPALAKEKLDLSREQHAAKGLKVLFKTKGESQGHAIIAPAGEKPINLLNPVRIEGDERLYVGFGTDGSAFDPNNLDEVNAVLADLHPELQATACAGHDWHNDEFSQGTWHMPRPTQNLRTLKAFDGPEGGIYFAGDYLGRGWMGFIDGAIESGLLVAEEIHAALIS
ncbi:MAG: monoamine oxidase [Gammaproteobacteria bacterium]|jgi:monoamine oxidase